MKSQASSEEELLRRIMVDPKNFGGKPIIRGRRLAVEHVLGMLAAGDRPETIPEGTLGWNQRTSRRASSTRADYVALSGLTLPLAEALLEGPAGYLRMGRCAESPVGRRT